MYRDMSVVNFKTLEYLFSTNYAWQVDKSYTDRKYPFNDTFFFILIFISDLQLLSILIYRVFDFIFKKMSYACNTNDKSIFKKINNGMFISLSRSIEKDNTYANWNNQRLSIFWN